MRVFAIMMILNLAGGALAQSAAEARTADFEANVRPVLKKYCAACHGPEKKKAGIDFTAFDVKGNAPATIGRVRTMRDVLSSGEMPPLGAEAPDAAARDRMIAWTKAYLDDAKTAAAGDVRRVTMRRLSRYEYRNTVRDLFGIVEDVTAAFPPDNLAYGFDTIGDATSFSLLHLEKYLAAAERIAETAIEIDDPKNPAVRHFECEFMTEIQDGVNLADMAQFYASGRIEQKVKLPRDGTYIIRARATADQAGADSARLGIFDDKTKIVDVEVPERRPVAAVKERSVELKGGVHRLVVTFLNDYYNPDDPDPKNRDRNLAVDWIEIVGPTDQRPRPAAQQRFFAKDPGRGAPEWRAKFVVEPLLAAAFRRPPTAREVFVVSDLVKKRVSEGATFEAGIRAALVYALVSPHFLYRLEAAPSGRMDAPLDDYAQAVRLSYFLWSSVPDAALLGRAEKGELKRRDVRIEEARRMLKDPRADALAENFASLWLELRNLDDLAPDPARFAAFTPEIRDDARREAQLFFLDCLRRDRPVHDFIDAKDTFLNGRLAAFYGIPGVEGDAFRRVETTDDRRGGLLGQASMLALTSNPTRTSPVKRGKWVLENILDAATPPPPPGVDGLKNPEQIHSAQTLRERMAEHRKSPDCSVCHDRLDGLGLALENYDPIGRWRDADGGVPVDAGGILPGGRRINGPADLRRVLRSDPGFVRCLAKKLFIYAYGKDVTPTDALWIDDLLRRLPPDPTLTDIILGLL